MSETLEISAYEQERIRIWREGGNPGPRTGKPSAGQMKREYAARRQYAREVIDKMAKTDYSMAVSGAKVLGLPIPERPEMPKDVEKADRSLWNRLSQIFR
jgi:hypothetical protein